MLIPHTDTSVITSWIKLFIAFCMTPLYTVYSGAEWYLLAVLVCIIADYRFGRGESAKRYQAAKEKGDKAAQLHYQWRRSRAWRRTLTKMADYFFVVTLGVFIGHAFLPHVGLDYWWGGFVATAICCLCELVSIFGHFFFLKGLEINPQTLKRTASRFAISLAKHKDPDIGESLEEALKEETAPSKSPPRRGDLQSGRSRREQGQAPSRQLRPLRPLRPLSSLSSLSSLRSLRSLRKRF